MVKIDSPGGGYSPYQYSDLSAGKAIEGLKHQPGTIGGEAMEKAIHDATKDLDAQAAGKEYNDLKKFVSENWGRLSPDAREKFRVYEKYVMDARSKGSSGIPQNEYNKMLQEMKAAGYEDASAGKAIEGLKDKYGIISGDDMEKAIINATKDLDAQAAGKEYADLKKFATDNWSRLSPEAKEKFQIYEKYAQQAQSKGQSGIPLNEYNKMVQEIKFSEYEDQSTGNIIEGLKDKSGPITGQDMEHLIIDGTRDLDAQAAGKEYDDISRFVKDNWGRLTPEAREKFGVYEKYVAEAKSQGHTGIAQNRFDDMTVELRAVGYQDWSAGQAIEKLKNTPGEISGPDMEKCIIDATKDLDSQAAGREYADLKKFADDNWDRLSPDAREKFRVYENTVMDCKAQGRSYIPIDQYNRMVNEMHAAGYKDDSAGRAIEELRGQSVPVSGDAMQKAIVDATKDLDSQAAGREYDDLKKYAMANWNNLSPDAKAKFQVYEQHVLQARAQGQTGIPLADYNKMIEEMKLTGYQDASAGAAIEALKTKGGQISGDDMQKAIIDATKDLDAQAAGKEYADLKKFADENWDRLSPDAKEKFRVYEQYVQNAQAQGQTGIPLSDYMKMISEMNAAGYADATAGAAIEGLKSKAGQISGDDMYEAIHNATKDLDAQAAGKEYADLKKFADENWDRLSPDAKEKFRVYEEHVQAAKAQGMSGIPQADYNQMLNEMKAAGYADATAGAAIEGLKSKAGQISGDDMYEAIHNATKDLDAQAAGKEYTDLKKFVTDNWDRLSPDAREKFRVYEEHVQAAQAQGMTGIPQADYDKMLGEMKAAGYADATAAAAIEDLKAKPGVISGDDMYKAIHEATKDLDSQAAGKEYDDLKKFATENWDRLSPDAREKFRVYDQYAQDAQAKGMTGIPINDYNRMLGEMRAAGYQDASAANAIEGLKSRPGLIPGDAMERAIIDATKDLDNQAAGKEYADLKKFATDNWDRLSPDAKEKFRVYERCALEAQATGKTGIPLNDYNKMLQEMSNAGYADATAAAAIEKLKDGPQPVSGVGMEHMIIDAVKDLDAQAAGTEYSDIARYAYGNWENLSPDARETFKIYENYALNAQMEGRTYLTMNEFNQMRAEMTTNNAATQISGKVFHRIIG